ncbi:dnc, partial [Symbiodinium sp. KB8]
VRKHIISMILATDNEYHFHYLAKLKQALPSTSSSSSPVRARHHESKGAEADAESEEEQLLRTSTLTSTPDGQLLTLQNALHAADVSNSAKPWDYYNRWVALLMDEFFAQGDLEREKGVGVTPFMDRNKQIPMPKFQIGFINAIVLPLYQEFNRVPGVNIDVPVETLESNLAEWNRQVKEAEAKNDKELNVNGHVSDSSGDNTSDGELTPREEARLAASRRIKAQLVAEKIEEVPAAEEEAENDENEAEEEGAKSEEVKKDAEAEGSSGATPRSRRRKRVKKVVRRKKKTTG